MPKRHILGCSVSGSCMSVASLAVFVVIGSAYLSQPVTHKVSTLTVSNPAVTVTPIVYDKTIPKIEAAHYYRHATLVRAAALHRAALLAAQRATAARIAARHAAIAQAAAVAARTVHKPVVKAPVAPVTTVAGTTDGIPTILLYIRSCESGANGYATHGRAEDVNWTNENHYSSASGGYQFLDSTWDNFGGYSRAMYAPASVQNQKALLEYQADGTSPWVASQSCWGG